MAVTQDDINALNAAIAAGTRQVTIGSQTILYQTTESLIKARDDMLTQLKKQSGTTKRSRQMLAYQSTRGYDQ